MASKVRINGSDDPSAGSRLVADRPGRLFKVTQTRAIRVDRARAASDKPVEAEIDDDDVIEIELEGGVRLWTTLDEFKRDFPTAKVRGEETGPPTLPTEIAVGTPSRGIAGWVIKGLRLLKVDVAAKAARAVAARLEAQLKPGPGLYKCTPTPAGFDLKKAALPADRPILLFIHGTASNTNGSFGKLCHPANHGLLDDLQRFYDGQLFAFEHRTLTQSPIANAIDLLNALPKNARLHLVTHSRGGMVGELLSRAGVVDGDPIDADDLDLLESRPDDRKLLAELGRLLKAKRPSIERFVRVACPVRGTTLASERLDRWLSITVNLLSWAGLEANPIFDLVSDLTLAVVKTRTKPEDLPGIEAMMPRSPLVAVLNRPVKLSSDLTVIAGDIEGEGVLGKLKLLIPDLFYRDDHDLVVNTNAMFGGAARSNEWYFFDQGPEVSHFRYFENASTASRLGAALIRPEKWDARFEVGAERIAGPKKARGDRGLPRPIAFVLPGIMGTHLKVNGDRVWVDVLDLARGGFHRLKIDAGNVQPDELVASFYSELVDYLDEGASHEVISFPYDWRRSLSDSARALAAAIRSNLDRAEKTQQPIRIVAHSMGGLVVRMFIAQHPDVWQRMCKHDGCRVIMLGTPNGGSFSIPRVLVGQEGLAKILALADLKLGHDLHSLVEIIAQFPGALEMLPADGGEFDFFSPDAWARIGAADPTTKWTAPTKEALAAARRTRSTLDSVRLDPKRVLYIAGCDETPCDIRLATSEPFVRFDFTRQGDGRVLWDTGIPKDVSVWFARDVNHGDLSRDDRVLGAIADLLVVGKTARLSSQRPSERGLAERFERGPDPVQYYPGAEDLVASAMGGRPKKRKRAKTKIEVSVAHANLAFASHVIAVGHYEGDTIVSAESYLDGVLHGRLRERLRLGLYPGRLGTSAVFLNDKGKPCGALVVGLGPVGKLSPGDLTSSIASAILNYAGVLLDQRRRNGDAGSEPQALDLSTLLIGSGAGGFPVRDALFALLRGTRRAAEKLSQTELDQKVVLRSLEVVEIYEDVAIQVGQTLQQFAKDKTISDLFSLNPSVRICEGGRRRVTHELDQPWWNRLQVTGTADDRLLFKNLTDKARNEVTDLTVSRAPVDAFVARSITKTATDDGVARTLFEMLLPNSLKERAPENRDVVLLVDDISAAYPWELLEDQYDPEHRPRAVQAGIIRQLETSEYREFSRPVSGRRALVVGDPPSNFVELKGAQDEADDVMKLLQASGFSVVAQIRESATSILSALHDGGYQILHLAGHGVYDYSPPIPVSQPEDPCTEHKMLRCRVCNGKLCPSKFTGMVLGESIFLTPGDVEQMRIVPELVFINCCHLGRIDAEGDEPDRRQSHRLAANLAAEFIRMGVRAVVAAGWAVDDNAARNFASTFYREMLAGRPFGKAVLTARTTIYEQNGSVNTWGAYQCYGDPDYRLQGMALASGTGGDKYVMITEAVLAAENAASEAGTATDKDRDELRKRLDRLVQDVPSKWLADAVLCQKLGRAYGELGCFDEAVTYYGKALEAEKARASLDVIEQRANLETRHALKQLRSGAMKPAVAQKTIKDAIKSLTTLLKIGKTSERLSVLGASYKRLVQVSSGPQRATAIKSMTEAYKSAYRLKKDPDPYPGLNWLTGELLSDWFSVEHKAKGKRTKKPLAVLRVELPKMEAVSTDIDNKDPSFWHAVYPTDCKLLRYLAEDKLDTYVDEIVAAYAAAKLRSSSPREASSIDEQLGFLVEMLNSPMLKKSKTDQRRALETIRKKLGG